MLERFELSDEAGPAEQADRRIRVYVDFHAYLDRARPSIELRDEMHLPHGKGPILAAILFLLRFSRTNRATLEEDAAALPSFQPGIGRDDLLPPGFSSLAGYCTLPAAAYDRLFWRSREDATQINLLLRSVTALYRQRERSGLRD